MPSIAHLPVELTLNIIECLRPHVSYMDTNEALMSQDTIVKRSDASFNAFIDSEEDENNREGLLSEENERKSEMHHRSAYSDLGSLRQ